MGRSASQGELGPRTHLAQLSAFTSPIATCSKTARSSGAAVQRNLARACFIPRPRERQGGNAWKQEAFLKALAARLSALAQRSPATAAQQEARRSWLGGPGEELRRAELRRELDAWRLSPFGILAAALVPPPENHLQWKPGRCWSTAAVPRQEDAVTERCPPWHGAEPMSPTGLVCDRRLLQRYIRESFELEDRVSSCGVLPLLQQPVCLPLVGFNFREWATKTNPSKGKEVLHDLVQLVDGVTAAQQEMREGCPSVLLQQLFEKGSFFVLQLQSFRWQEQDPPGQPEGTPQLILERNPRKIFQTYKQLLRGKLYFLFSDLRKDLCSEGGSH